MIPQSFIDDLIARLDIVDVVGKRIQLKRAGANLSACCPFHDERSPSFTVSPTKQFYHCLAGETGVVTRHGVRPIRDLAGATHTILDGEGHWVNAPFRSFGVQPLQTITLSRNGLTKTIRATSGHRWFVHGRRSATTTCELHPGQQLAAVLAKSTGGRTLDPAVFRHGTGIGDEPTQGVDQLCWTVVSIAPPADTEEVFCAEVPGTHAFSLEDNLLTGNCFGCGAHGTAIRFVMEYESIGFVEAVEGLAASVGLEVPNERGSGVNPGRGRAETLRPLLDAAAAFYRQKLRETPRAVEYLKGRGLTGEVARRFGLGYAPDGWDALAAAFPDYRGNANLVEAGLVVAGEAGKRHDRFRDRIMFPITDAAGRMIGFGGRILDRGEPKYLNSPETPLFSKGRELFGLWPARDALKRDNRAIVVEGYMDVVALAQHGVGNAVATLGTSTTPMHVQKLLRMVDEIVFCFDGDAAGRKAAWRALENSLGALRDDARIKFLFLPDGEDPDTFVRQIGFEGFTEALGRASSLAEFMVRDLMAQAEGDAVESAAQIVHRAEPLLRQIQAPALALLLRKRVADAAGLSTGEVDVLVGQVARNERPRAPALKTRQVTNSLAALLLSRILRAPGLVRHIETSRCALLGDDPAARALLAVIEICAGQPDVSVEDLAGQLRDTAHAAACRDAARLTRDLPEDVDLAQEVVALAVRLPEAPRSAGTTDLAALDPAARAAWLADLRRRKGVSDQ